MSATPLKNDWNTRDGKKAIFRGIMEHFKKVPSDIDDCVNKPEKAIDVVQTYGNTVVPPGSRVVFLPRGDNLKGDGARIPFAGMHYNAGASLIITIPPENASDDAALRYACSYQIWDP